jgi:adenylate cyclase
MTGLSLTPDRRRALFGLVAALCAALLLSIAGGDRVSRPVFDQWHRTFPQPASPRQVEIVWIDEASVRTLGPWPWPRYTMARLVAKLGEDKARLIGLDMLLPEPDRQNPEAFVRLYPELAGDTAAEIRALPSMDALFGQVIGQTPVVLGRAGVDAPALKTPPALAVEARFSRPLPPGVRRWGQALANIAEIDDVGLGHGLLNGDADSDGIVRRVPLVGRVAGADTPGFALELARVAGGAGQLEPVIKNNTLRAISLGGILLPTRPDGTMPVPFRAPSAAPPLSALDILYDLAPSARVEGKIVIVGLSGVGTADVVSTPLAAQGYGATVHADAVEAIVAGTTLSRPPWAWLAEALLTLVLLVIAVAGMPGMRARWAGLAGFAAILITFAISAAAFRAGLLIDPVTPVGIAAAAAVTLLLLLFAKARNDLQDQRLIAARADGELSAARTIQLGMLPSRDTLAGFDPAVDLDALIEPARSIGGDFYDAIRLDEHRIIFLVGDVTGKGVPAALFMALSKALAKSVMLRDGADLGAAVSRLNDEIARDNRETMFVTMLVGLLDTRSGALSLCCAGHENPWLVRASGAIEALRPDGGPPLAVAPGFSYPAESWQLGRGDALVIVSDGITEAQSPEGGFFGTGRIERILRRWASDQPAQAASDALLEEVRIFEAGAEATDDLTVLVVRYLT